MRYLIAAAAVTLILGVVAQTALAHTHVAESNPADGAAVETAPTSVTVRFGEPEVAAPGAISDGHLEVVDPCGLQVDKKDSQVNMQDSSITVGSAGTPKGRYEIHWFVTSADGAVQAGVLDFNVTSGEPCPKVSRTDAEKDIEVGADVTSLSSKLVSGGGVVTLKTAAALDCASYGAETDDQLRLLLDTNSDRTADFTGTAICKKDVWKLNLTSSEEESTGSLKMSQPKPTTLKLKIPKQSLVAHVDVWAETSSAAGECDGSKVCFDLAPDLGLVRAY